MPGPLVITGTGGSGTRVVAEIAMRAGWSLGTKLNDQNDNMRIANVENHPVGTRFLEDGGPTDAQLAHYLHVIDSERWPHDRWGWKHPQTMHFIRWVYDAYPETLRVLHVVRDGRDMAYATNVFEHWFGRFYLGDSERSLAPEPVRNVKLWARANDTLRRFCEKHLPNRYHVLRLEDLVSDPAHWVGRVFGWLGGPVSELNDAVGLVREPDSLDRWLDKPEDERAAVCQAAEPGLRTFGYAA